MSSENEPSKFRLWLLLALLSAVGCGGTISTPNPAPQGTNFDDGFATPAPSPTPGIRNYSFTATVTTVGTRTDIERGTELSGTIRLDPSSLATGGSIVETADGVRYILTPVQATVTVAGETFGFCRIVEVRVRDDAALLFDQPGEGDSVFIRSFFACGAGQEPDHVFQLYIADYDGQMLDSTDLPHSNASGKRRALAGCGCPGR